MLQDKVISPISPISPINRLICGVFTLKYKASVRYLSIRAITRDHDKPEDAYTGRPEGMPIIARMARHYLGRLASSAGVERMFSKAGKLQPTTSRHRRLMTRWSTRSWPPLTMSENWLVCSGCLAEQAANGRPHVCDVRCALCVRCAV